MITKAKLGCAALLLGFAAISPAAHAGTISACPTTVNAAGTWTVTKDLTATATCITITAAANGAAIDLNGHTITGPGGGAKDLYGITDSGSCTPSCQQHIIIANGTIKGFTIGVYLASTRNATISNMKAMGNFGTGISVVQDHAVVTGSQANNNDHGITLGGSSIVTNSQANDNGDTGIAISGRGTIVSNSQANGNNGYGIQLSDFGGDTVDNSQANNNGVAVGGAGIVSASPSGGNTITGSQANGNKGKSGPGYAGGILIKGPGNLLAGNTTNGNLAVGITVDCPSNLYGNTATGNGSANIVLTPTSAGCARLDNNPAP